jgi:hypothetical protein
MELCHSYQHVIIPLRATRRYTWEILRDMCKRRTGPFWLRVEGTLVALESETALQTGCKVCSAYHDWVAYNVSSYSDGSDEDMPTVDDKEKEGKKANKNNAIICERTGCA